MSQQTTTQIKDWSFFEKVAKAAFANPFGKTRDDLDMEIGGTSPGTPPEKILNAVIARVSDRISTMQREGSTNLREHSEERREVLQSVFLFHVFHRYADRFDGLIQTQMRDDDSLTWVSFAQDALKELSGFGLSEQEAARFFAIFYQLRRAYYFIKNGLVGNSPSMIELRKHLWGCVFTHDSRWYESRLWNRMEDFSVLLLGETGTGKGAAAAAIGRSGFIPLTSRAAALPPALPAIFWPPTCHSSPKGYWNLSYSATRKALLPAPSKATKGCSAAVPQWRNLSG
jgi:hypothetical protein